MSKKYQIITYGCQMNKSDSERIAGFLENKGYKPALKEEKADLIVVNMCSVRQSAVDRVYGLTQKVKKLKTMPRAETKFLVRGKKPELKTILTGCILEKDKIKFKNNFDLILEIKNLPNWPKTLSDNFNSRQRYAPKRECNNHLEIQPKYQNDFSVFIPISNGCNNFCSYCVVPKTRGSLICRDHKEILKEVSGLVKKGLKEIWLIGQNVNDYHSRTTNQSKTNNKQIMKLASDSLPIRFLLARKSEVNFAKLLKMVNEIPGNFWIRFTSPHPKPSTRANPRIRTELGSGLSQTELRSGSGLGAGLVPYRPAPEKSRREADAGNFSWDELIETMAKCQKVTPYLNLPIQSGNNEVLEKMNRNYTVEEYKFLVKKIRAAFKKHRKGLERKVAISTDIIVGFPGETKKQFQDTLALFQDIRFDMAYIAQYSPRYGTAAAKLKNKVSLCEKERRWRKLSQILKKVALENNKKFVGKTVDVLVEESTNKNQKSIVFRGKTRHYKTVKFQASNRKSKSLVGKFVKVKIINALPWGLKGVLTKKGPK